MERVFAFIDESGAFGWDLANPSVSSHMIITAIIVKQGDLEDVYKQVEEVRIRNFQKGEMKSSSIGSNHRRRMRVLGELLPVQFSIFSVVIDKRQLTEMKGLQYKPSFYKFLNNIVHKELRRAFSKLTIIADQIGGSEYMQSFAKYVESKQDIPNLFGEAEFMFENSKNNGLIQLADLISGTIAYTFEPSKKSDGNPNYIKILEKKTIRIELYPKTYHTYILQDSSLAEDYDKDIAEICYRQAVDYISKKEDSDDEDIQAQIIVLKYLLFRFMNNDLRHYIPTKELLNQLAKTKYGRLSQQTFRLRIIGKMRDNGVIIASSSRGYKIPSKRTELFDFINHGTSIIMPMLNRLRKCRDLVKLGTLNDLDLFDNTKYSSLKRYFDNL